MKMALRNLLRGVRIPRARVGNDTISLHGSVVEDPFQWMQKDSDQLDTYLKEENQYMLTEISFSFHEGTSRNR